MKKIHYKKAGKLCIEVLIVLFILGLLFPAASFADSKTDESTECSADPQQSNGINVSPADSGELEVVTIDDKTGWKTKQDSGFFGFKCDVDDNFTKDYTGRYKITIEYYDDVDGKFDLLYEDLGNESEVVQFTGTKTWKSYDFYTNASIMNNKMQGFDFRLGAWNPKMGGSNSDIVIGKITVAKSEGISLDAITNWDGNVFREGDKLSIILEITSDLLLKADITTKYTVMSYDGRKVAEGQVTDSYEPSGVKKRMYVNLDNLTDKGTYIMIVDSKTADGRFEVHKEMPFSIVSKVANILEINNFLGIGCHFAQNKGDPELLLTLAKEAGIKNIRDEYYWGNVEKEKGVYTFDYDKYIDVAISKNIEPLVILSYGNELYDGGAAPSSDEGIAGFANYSKAVAEHLKGKVKYFEIWNEWNGGMGNSKLLDAVAYCKVLKAAYTAIKEANPDAYVVGGATVLADFGWVEQLLEAGGAQYMDAFSYHPYNSSPEGGAYAKTIKEMKDVLVKNGFNGPAWVTEIGWRSGDTSMGGNSELTLASYLIQTNVLTIANSVNLEKLFFYELYDDGTETMGLIREKKEDAVLSAKLGYVALTAYSKELAGAEFIKSYELDDNLRLFKFHRDSDNKDILIAWTIKDPMTVGLKLGSSKLDIIDIVGNSREAVPVNEVLSTTISSIPTYFEGVFPNNISLTTPVFKPDIEMKDTVAGDTITVNIKRTSGAVNLSGNYDVDLPDGWELLSDNSFKSGNEDDTLQIKVSDQLTETSSNIYIRPVDDSGNLLGSLKLMTKKVEPFVVSIAPNPTDTDLWDKWEVTIQLKNNYSATTLPAGKISILEPAEWADGKTYPYSELKPGDSQTINIPLSTIDLSEPDKPTVVPISQGKPAKADSEQSGNEVSKGNDDKTTTRWCAKDDKLGHWWEVDLGGDYDLTGVEIMWEMVGSVYKYKIEVSSDYKNWTLAVDKLNNTNANQFQRDILNVKGRYVRVTVTGLNPSRWASFWDCKIYDSANPMPSKAQEPLNKLKLQVKPDSKDPYIIEKNLTFYASMCTGEKITIDADLTDAEWQDAMSVTVADQANIVQMEDWTGPDDLSMSVRTKWDAQYFYLAVIVTDNIHYQPYDGPSGWQADGIQISTEPNRMTVPGMGGYNEMGFALNSDDNSIQKYRWNAIPGKTAGSFNQALCAIKRVDTNTIYEIAIPWIEIMPDDVLITDGLDIGFSILANDNDGEKRRGWIEYNSGIGLGKDATKYGDLTLVNPKGVKLDYATSAQESKWGSKNWLYILAGAVLLIIIGTVVYLFAIKKRK